MLSIFGEPVRNPPSLRSDAPKLCPSQPSPPLLPWFSPIPRSANRVRQAATPKHVVDLAKEQGHEFTQATMMRMQAERMQQLHDDHINDASSWGEALLLCFGKHS